MKKIILSSTIIASLLYFLMVQKEQRHQFPKVSNKHDYFPS
ncbi:MULTISPECIES: hypothetical protein [Enterococcus]|nr:hypothetical protein [Enterococcus alishanensis]